TSNYVAYNRSSTALWLPDTSDEDQADTESSPEPEEQTDSPTYETPLEQLARTRKERAARAESRRDPDWHPQYNPYYDPTSDQYAKKSTPLVRWR
ncbi:MAG: hypothetical protein CMO55_12305, partial [Verrucomicrobiales bacterium]|nr:hypothetical protein [Verrucomicrobiales bacterium]